jgi:N-glycosylase/DNA lyase
MTDDNKHLEQNPAIYLRQQPDPTSPCHLLVEQIGSHDGDHVPMHMLAKVAVRTYRLSEWGERFEKWWRTGKKLVAASAATALASVGGAYSSCQSAHDARIAREARAEAAERAFQEYRSMMDDKVNELRQDIREIRLLFRKFTGIDPGPVSNVSAYAEGGAEIVKNGAP